MRNKVGALLIAIQIAVTMCIIVNAIHIILERQELMARDSGIDEANSFHLISTGFANDFNEQVTIETDLNTIRALPGVIDAVQINAIPISGGGWSMGLQTQPGAEFDGVGTAVYMVDEHVLEALDLELIAGEAFKPTHVRWRERAQTNWPDQTIITKAMAESLFPEEPWQQVVGKTVYINDNEPILIMGIIDKLQAPWVGWNNVEHAMLSPEKTLFSSSRYLVRTEPGRRDELMPKVEEILAESNKGRIIRDVTSMMDTRERSYRRHGAMIKILTTVMVILTVVTALGIVGLASFSVNRRRKQIGTRRALGASQSAILRYFMLENFLISTVGVVLGAALTIGLNIYLVQAFSLDRIDWYFIPLGMLVLWMVGQLAVFGPAKRAAGIAPAIATRTV
ncbi:FtsX-like permease family protein [Bowmanella dokdonensis]|uniref:FtsX-like permease family protein n=2 Tax=Bowmanella dokdonensis TaxID=751969 RepID=A0A939DS50_9ALTE|nr:FtsX-like permease family protein [Bowmanella dokdonensis]